MALRQAAQRFLASGTRNAFARYDAMRALASSSDPYSGLPLDTLIKMDHNRVRHLFSEYDNTTEQDHKQTLAFTIIRELSMHSSKEEEVVYPEFGRLFGAHAQQHLCDEHYVLKLKLEKLSKLDITVNEKEFEQAVNSVRQEFLQHITEEEEQEIPRLLREDSVDGVALGRQFEKAAAHAVTRPHPMAPDKAPLNKVTNRMTAPLDAAADAIRFMGNVPKVDDVPPPTK